MPAHRSPHRSPLPPIPVEQPIAQRLAAAVDRYGHREVVDRAVALLAGENVGEDFLLYVGGEHARGLLAGAPALYWPELWGARALLHVWDDTAETTTAGTGTAPTGTAPTNTAAAAAVTAGLDNQAWRVREMCARVCRQHRLDAATGIRRLIADEVPRVRIAALRALAEIGDADDAATIAATLRDPDKEVRRAAQQSRDALAERRATPTDGAPPAAH